MVVINTKFLGHTALVTTFLSLTACATLPEPSTPMQLGATAAAPTGYLDFCRRQPEDCGGAPAPVIQKVAAIELARRGQVEGLQVAATAPHRTSGAATAATVNWSQAFAEARRRREMALLSNAAVEASLNALTLATEPPAPQGGLQRVSLTTPVSARPAPPRPLLRASNAPKRPAMTPELWSQLSRVNDKVNRSIAQRTDLQAYGVVDLWTTPIAGGQRVGDCEDYVLEKRRALIASGLPESALSIAVATTSWGERHAVLLVETDQGAYVLDSLTPWILPWRKANLVWHERQVDGAAFRWSMVAIGAPTTLAEPTPSADPEAVEDLTTETAPAMPEISPPIAPYRVASLTLAAGPLALRGRL